MLCRIGCESPPISISSPTFSVRPRSSVSRITVDLIRGRGFDSHRGQKIFSLPRVVPSFPLLGLTPSGLFMGSISTLICTSELILCSTICVHNAKRHNIHMYPYFLFAAIHHLYRPRLSLSDFVAQPESNARSNPDVVGSIPTEVKRYFLYFVWFPDSLP